MSKIVDLIIVTFQPNIKELSTLLNSIQKQVNKIYIVDNTKGLKNHLDKLMNENINIIYLYENMGIAYAQNIGIKEALKHQADYIMLSDQDTIYPENYIENMLIAFSEEGNISAVAPLFRDINQKNPNEGFRQKTYFSSKQIYPTKGFHEVYQVIASGKIIFSNSLLKIGFMNEALFIDYVDLEWCWRSKSSGYKILGNANVVITHKLGDDVVSLGAKNVTLRSPIRHYYMVRNSLYLSLTSTSLNYLRRLHLFFRSFYLMIGFSILSTPHLIHIKYTLRGIIDALARNTGKYKGNIND
ncbi:MAG: glycosyltransferase family 2 protein [Campylobacteraceae bacterium]|nr:glycosyltransferase family 2 protein [Campylobacteraceae bacterium]